MPLCSSPNSPLLTTIAAEVALLRPLAELPEGAVWQREAKALLTVPQGKMQEHGAQGQATRYQPSCVGLLTPQQWIL